MPGEKIRRLRFKDFDNRVVDDNGDVMYEPSTEDNDYRHNGDGEEFLVGYRTSSNDEESKGGEYEYKVHLGDIFDASKLDLQIDTEEVTVSYGASGLGIPLAQDEDIEALFNK